MYPTIQPSNTWDTTAYSSNYLEHHINLLATMRESNTNIPIAITSQPALTVRVCVFVEKVAVFFYPLPYFFY